MNGKKHLNMSGYWQIPDKAKEQMRQKTEQKTEINNKLNNTNKITIDFSRMHGLHEDILEEIACEVCNRNQGNQCDQNMQMHTSYMSQESISVLVEDLIINASNWKITKKALQQAPRFILREETRKMKWRSGVKTMENANKTVDKIVEVNEGDNIDNTAVETSALDATASDNISTSSRTSCESLQHHDCDIDWDKKLLLEGYPTNRRK